MLRHVCLNILVKYKGLGVRKEVETGMFQPLLRIIVLSPSFLGKSVKKIFLRIHSFEVLEIVKKKKKK